MPENADLLTTRTGLTASERSIRAARAANVGWAYTPNRTTRTQPGRDAFLESLERKVDPNGELTPAERRKRAENLRRAHMQQMALKSAKARRQSPASERSC